MYKNYLNRRIIRMLSQNSRSVLTGMALVLILLAGIALYFTDKYKESSLDMGISFLKIPPKIISVNNSDSTFRHIALPDGSSVLIHPGCELNYPLIFSNKNREIFLEGNAYFKVMIEESRPFIVKTSELIATTNNAFFMVKSEKTEKEAFVTVDSGQVLVSLHENLFTKCILNPLRGSSLQEVILMPDQEAVFDKIGEIITKIQRQP